MTTDTYRNFIAIVECGNILAASQKLMVAQPALSNQLKNLEKNMGTRLLNRGSRAVTRCFSHSRNFSFSSRDSRQVG